MDLVTVTASCKKQRKNEVKDEGEYCGKDVFHVLSPWDSIVRHAQWESNRLNTDVIWYPGWIVILESKDS